MIVSLPVEPIKYAPPAIQIIEERRLEALRRAEEARLAQIALQQAEAARIAAEQARAHLINHLTNGYPRRNSFAWGNCTYFVAGLINIPWSGNANAWDERARRLGYPVDSNPTVGSVAQSDRGWAGHVAIVIGVSGDQVLIREMNVLGLNRISQRWVHVSQYEYIHVPV